MESARDLRNQWPALGKLLIREGLVTSDELDHALSLQRLNPGVRLGEVLVAEGYTASSDISRLVAEQHELEFVELETTPIDASAAMLLPESLARHYQALPIRFVDDGCVLIAVADPTNVVFADELRLAIGVPVRLCVSAPESIDTAIARLHQEAASLIEEVITTAAETEDSASVLDLHHDTPAVVFINRVISKALDLRASDIHFTPQQRRLYVRIRVDGVLRELSSIAGTQAGVVAARLKIMGGLDIAERRMPQDGRFAIRRGDESLDVRIAVLPAAYGEKITLRILSQGEAPASLDELGMSPRSRSDLADAISKPYGAVVVVGPTGSGKTTTLFACMRMLNTPERQLTTIEDPVEYRTEGLDQIEVNTRSGLSFATGLRTILRSDPDVLLIGEIRDEETAQIAFRAAMTGHLVLTTLHAQSSASAIQRLRDMNVAPSVLATSINCIVAQRLARRVCRECCREIEPSDEILASLMVETLSAEATFVESTGCTACGDTGYRGRIPLFEVMPMSDDLADHVEAPTREIEEMATLQGMSSLRESGIALAAAGIVTLEEVRRVVGSVPRDRREASRRKK